MLAWFERFGLNKGISIAGLWAQGLGLKSPSSSGLLLGSSGLGSYKRPPNPKTLNPFKKMLLSPLKDLHDTSCAFYEDLRDPEDLENRERKWLRGKDFVGLEKAL